MRLSTRGADYTYGTGGFVNRKAIVVDILAALEAEPTQGDRRCNLRAFLDAIPEGTAGRDELIRLVETPHDRKSSSPTKSGERMAVILTSLGHECTENVVHQHRNRACACYR